MVKTGSLVLLASWAIADDAPSAGNEKLSAESTAKDVKSSAANPESAALIEQLDSPDFDTREQACAKLAALGKAATEALEKAGPPTETWKYPVPQRGFGKIAEIHRRGYR